MHYQQVQRTSAFGITKVCVTKPDYAKIVKIARAHDADFTGGAIPGTGEQYWFTAENLGETYIRSVQSAVFDALPLELIRKYWSNL